MSYFRKNSVIRAGKTGNRGLKSLLMGPPPWIQPCQATALKIPGRRLRALVHPFHKKAKQHFHTPAASRFITRNIRPSCMSLEPEKRKDGITHDIVRFLAWLKKRGAQQRLLYCRKKWDGKGIDIKVICRGPARGMMRVQHDPSTGEKWVVLDDLVRADNLMIEFGEEVPHHNQWTEL